jgi:hypothetical protein
MNGLVIDRILARQQHGLDAGQQAVLRRMADYLDRNSLRVVWDNGLPGPGLEIHVSNDAERFAVTVAELGSLWEGLRAGRAVDWASLRRVESREGGWAD